MNRLQKFAGWFCILTVVSLWLIFCAKTNNLEFDGQKPKYYNSSGLIQNKQVIYWVDTVAVTSVTANQTLNVSVAGFSQILSATETPLYPGASASSIATINNVTWTPTTITFRTSIQNQISIPVLTTSITAIQFATTVPTGLKAAVKVIGW